MFLLRNLKLNSLVILKNKHKRKKNNIFQKIIHKNNKAAFISKKKKDL